MTAGKKDAKGVLLADEPVPPQVSDTTFLRLFAPKLMPFRSQRNITRMRDNDWPNREVSFVVCVVVREAIRQLDYECKNNKNNNNNNNNKQPNPR